jgi:D-beta-D-heptose 7-phosphate kinase/D-beta-D-heptose 1-phosphate adenosyltransferase
MTAPRIVVIGDVILDRTVEGTSERLCPDAPVPVIDVARTAESPGGAGLAAMMLAGTGADVSLVAALGNDPAGRRLAGLLAARTTVLACGQPGPTRCKTRVRSAGQSLVRLDEGGPADPTDVPVADLRDALQRADAVLVSDYGAGVTADPRIRGALTEAAVRVPLVWDPHPRGARPVDGTTLVTPNLAEARRALAAGPDLSPAAVAHGLARRWPVRAVAVTAGAAGAFLAQADQEVRYLPAGQVSGGDTCGAGDRFAATAAVVLAGRGLLSEAVRAAVADATAWVRGDDRPAVPGPMDGVDGPPTAAAPAVPSAPAAQSAAALARDLRAGGRTVVATGGCFDIVHAGHVATLQAARRLGDRLVVLVNSDASVRRLKGAPRPIVPEQDRARVLQALDCVDAVIVFDDDDPRRVLDQLRPNVWVKGGDYGGTPLPESDVVAEHGGETVFVPYLAGRSTTGLIERARTTRPHAAAKLEELR